MIFVFVNEKFSIYKEENDLVVLIINILDKLEKLKCVEAWEEHVE